jgi:hypothetical protein
LSEFLANSSGRPDFCMLACTRGMAADKDASLENSFEKWQKLFKDSWAGNFSFFKYFWANAFLYLL